MITTDYSACGMMYLTSFPPLSSRVCLALPLDTTTAADEGGDGNENLRDFMSTERWRRSHGERTAVWVLEGPSLTGITVLQSQADRHTPSIYRYQI